MSVNCVHVLLAANRFSQVKFVLKKVVPVALQTLGAYKAKE